VAEYVYTTVPGKIKPLFGKIREVGVPQKVTVQWLKTLGYTSSNDKSLLPVLKQVNLVDSSGIPNSNWTQYRGANYKALLGTLIRSGYADLFSVYPDANQRTPQEIEHVFSTVSTAGKQVVSKTVSTFRELCEMAEFSDSDIAPSAVEIGPMHAPVVSGRGGEQRQGRGGPSLHIDMQIHISPDSTPEQIDQIFKSMAKHLYGAEAE
jgi:hypothetical protein